MNNVYKMKLSYFLLIIVGTAGVAFAVQCMYDPCGLVTGGFSGISIIVKSLTEHIVPGGIPLWLTNLLLNIPVFIVAYIKMGKRFIGRTLFGTVMLSVWLYVLPVVDLTQGDMLLVALFGGVFSGAGMGLVLRANATTGGTDMVAALIQLKIRHYNVAQIMQILDGAIVVLGFFVFGLRPSLYAIVAIFVTTKVSDAILEGFKYSKAAYIITDKYEEVAQVLMEELDRGATGLKATGMYTGRDRCVLYCVVSKKQIVTLKEIVVNIDPKAFVIVSDVREVLGEGFLDYKAIGPS
ncbi:MAG: YitT family protein [Agathobacter sp.]|nr:YitT family protein [Agathobacter sp.]